MQNFTLGKKGISMLFFAFILLIGSSPSFGQTCPEPGDFPASQTFCYLQTIDDLDTDGFPVFQTSDTEGDTQAIPGDELLTDGAIYFVNNSTGDCRSPLSVTVTNAPRPSNRITNSVVSGFEFTTCTPASFNSDNLANLFDPQTNYRIEVYGSEESTTPLIGATLSAGSSYFVGQVPTNTAAAGSCPSFRVAVGFNPNQIEAPNVERTQTFCENATVADLVAQGTYNNTQAIRWYRSQTANSPLASNTQLINGQTYFAAQVVNARGSITPPCETSAGDRAAVLVNIDDSTLNETTQSFCASVGTGNDFRMPQVQDLAPQGGTFYAESDSDLPLDPTTVLVEGEDYFNRATGNDCTQDRITVQFFDTPNAGSTTFTSACVNDPSFDLVSRINNSLLGAPQTTGFFTPALASGTNIFTPEDYAAGSYTFTYTIEGNTNCPTDTSIITVEVQPAPNAGPDQTITFCQSEIETLVNLALSDPAAAQAILTQRIGNADLTGNFGNTDLQNIALGYLQAVNNNAFPFSADAVYTVDNGNCQDSAKIKVVVNESPYAGDDTNIEVNSTQEPFNLYDVLVENSNMTPNTGGEFSPGNVNGDFNPATATSGTYTYTVTNEFGCTDTANINITVLVDLGCPEVTETPQSFCESISDADGNNPRRPRVRDLSPMEATWYPSADSDTPIPGNTILVDGNVYFAGNTNGTCNNRMPVRVNIDPAPNAGATTILNVCSADAPFNISSRMNPSILGAADAGGSIFPALASGTDLFDPSVDNAGRYTYRVASANSGCEDDTAFVTINITDPIIANAGADVSLTFCSTDGIIDLNTRLANDAFPGGSFSGLTNGQFDPSKATIGVNTITYTVDNSIACVSGTDVATYTINVTQGPNAGQDGSVTFSNLQEGTFNLFAYLQGNPTAGGSWNPGNVDGTFTPQGKEVGTYEFIYTVTNDNDCSDTATVTVTITDENITCPEIADTTQEFCESISDVDGNNPRRPQVRDLLPMNVTWYATATSTEALAPNTILLDNVDYFAGNSNGDCPNRASVNVQIGKAPNAGATTNIIACSTETPFDIVSRLNPSLLGTAMSGGTITPAFASGTTVFNPAVDAGRQYRYTVQSEFGKCEDDFTFVNITITEPLPANAGADVSLTFCSNEDVQNLYDFIGTDGNTQGSFGDLTDGLFNPSENVGTTTFTYTVDGSVGCTTGTDSSTFTITVTEPQTADAGDDIAASYCVDQTEDVDLRSLLPEANRNRGSFSAPYQDGIFNPSAAGEGVVTLTYSLNGAEDCAIGTDEATITITVNGISEAPVADADQTFCFVKNPTVADLSATGSNIVWYEDATLTIVAESTDPLVTGEDYYAVATTDENSCGSTAVMVNVTINDSDAPTLQLEGNEFCRQDNPTVQDLVDNVNGTNVAIYSSEDGGTALAASTTLQNGITYYATSTDSDFGCESTERLAIVVKVGFCGIPEGFSPNGDQINDRFVIPDIATDYPNYTIEIFNRWGQVVFEGNASTGDWDGISNRKTTLGNDVLPAGVYFYILKYNDGVTSPVQGKLYLSR